MGAHNWHRLWESPAKLWFGRDLTGTKQCLKDILEAVPRADSQGPLGRPLGGSEDRKDVQTGSGNWQRNNLALEKGRIKHSEQYRALWGMTNTKKETKKLSGYAGW